MLRKTGRRLAMAWRIHVCDVFGLSLGDHKHFDFSVKLKKYHVAWRYSPIESQAIVVRPSRMVLAREAERPRIRFSKIAQLAWLELNFVWLGYFVVARSS